MTLEELANIEQTLNSKVIDLNQQRQTERSKQQLADVFEEYRNVHQAYSELCVFELEALKRGIFIQWYQISEPFWLTGINGLNEEAENKIVEILNQTVDDNRLDQEFIWMLNYYSNWDFIFDKHSNFKGFDKSIINDKNNHLPHNIDREFMRLRGLMGRYWNSLAHFA